MILTSICIIFYGYICIEDMTSERSILDTRVYESMMGHPGILSNILPDLFGDDSITVDANLFNQQEGLWNFISFPYSIIQPIYMFIVHYP